MIEAKNLSKHFKTLKKEPGFLGAVKGLFSRKYDVKKAVDGISFEIDKGEMVGYIGANGAGKSTTIKMMTGILTPTSGECTVGGLIPYKNRQKNARQIGVVFGQKTQLWWDLPLSETFSILKEIYRVEEKAFNERYAFLDEVLGLKEFLSSPVRTLSLGQRMRADLASALLHNPSVLFLDEPTIGLDVVVKEKILAAIKNINKEYGTTLILTTHDMADIEELCSRIIIIDEGQIMFDGSLEEIKNRYGYNRILKMEARNHQEFSDFPLGQKLGLGEKDIRHWLEDGSLFVRFDRRKTTAASILDLTLKPFGVMDMSIQETPIEDIVKQLYKKGLREEGAESGPPREGPHD
jgi:ABC-2 type transport system ATP-binding protein